MQRESGVDDDGGEGSPVSNTSQFSLHVNVELGHLRAEIRLQQQQDGIRPVVASVEANHIPVERQKLESWMNHRAVELRVAIQENNAARRLQLIALLAEGQPRFHSLEEEDALLEEDFCATAPGEGRFAPEWFEGHSSWRSFSPGPTTGPTRWDTSSDEELFSRLCEVSICTRGRC